jgi:transcriptional regulator with XRE-family HTH domain
MTEILDGKLIRTLRLEKGTSRQQLAKETKMSERTLAGIERGDNHRALPLRYLVSLAHALGLHPGQLFLQPDTEGAPQRDDVRIEAALLSLRRHRPTAHIRKTLGLTHEQWDEAMQRIRARLADTGSTLISHDNGQSLITAREGVLTKGELAALRGPEQARNDLTLQQAQMLKRVIDGETDVSVLTKYANQNQRLALGYLEKNEIVRHDNRSYRLAGEIKYSLGLSDLPPRARRKPQ